MGGDVSALVAARLDTLRAVKAGVVGNLGTSELGGFWVVPVDVVTAPVTSGPGALVAVATTDVTRTRTRSLDSTPS